MRASLILLLGAFTAAPMALLAAYSFARNWYWPSLLPFSWDLYAWQYVFSEESEVLDALSASFQIAVAVTVIAVAISLPAARVLAWRRFPGKRQLLFVLLLPVLSPPLAATMGLHGMFLRIGLTGTAAGVILAHLIPAVPYAILMLTGSFTRLDPDLEAQARTLGATRWHVMRHVTLPAIAPGVAVAASFAFLISWSQYLTTLLIGGGETRTLPIILVSFQSGGDPAIAAALCLVFLIPAVIAFGSVARFLDYGT